MAAAPSSVPADRDEAFVWDTVNDIGLHGLECDITVFLIEMGSKWGPLRDQLGTRFCLCVVIKHVCHL